MFTGKKNFVLKEQLKERINNGDLAALLIYAREFNTDKNDIRYLLFSFDMMRDNYEKCVDKKSYLTFWCVYIRFFTSVLKNGKIENSDAIRKKVEEVIIKIHSEEYNSSSFYICAARYFREMFNKDITEYDGDFELIISLYMKAAALGSSKALLEKERFMLSVNSKKNFKKKLKTDSKLNKDIKHDSELKKELKKLDNILKNGNKNGNKSLDDFLNDDEEVEAQESYAIIDDFDINLVNTDVDLVKITSKLEKATLPFTMLISGPPGTGKSYYLRYLAAKMNMRVIEKTATELFSSYQGEPAKNVLKLFNDAEKTKSIIIMDEVEKVIGDREARGSNTWRADMTNAFLTSLEKAKYPFMATTNFVAEIDKAILRRFVFKIKFDYLNDEQVAYAFRFYFDREPPEALFKIGGLTNGDFAVVKKKAQILDVIEDTNELLEMLKYETSFKTSGRVIDLEEQTLNYDRNFINIEGNSLDLYVKKIKENKIENFSILLHGPSGTGKSLYLRNLAKEFGIEVIERRASDLVSKWGGESEQNIAKAFEEAKDRRAMLIFDEIDSLIPNKNSFTYPHTVRIVNEFLVQLENHPYPICATTNYLNKLEHASIRRFKINAKLDYLRKDQYLYVYNKIFGVDPIRDISGLKKLTPAIFNLAAEKVSLEGVENNAERIFEIFLNEVKSNTGITFEEEDKTYENLIIDCLPLYKTPIYENYDNILAGFVKIIVDDAHGSGFFITGDGFILTNKHVVGDQKIVQVELFSGRTVPGEVIRVNNLDIALVKISSENKVLPLPIRTSELNVGSTVFCLGNPKYRNQVLSKGCITSYTVNKIKNNTQRIETDCFMANGSSGGPLLDECGNVIGVNAEGWSMPNTDIKLNLGLYLHISINDALNCLNIRIKKDGD